MSEVNLEFKKIELSDKPWIDELLHKSDFRGSEFCFANNYTWSAIYHYRICRYKDFYLQFNDDFHHFSFPAGEGDLREMIEVMIRYSEQEGFPFVLHLSHEENKQKLESLFPDYFDYEERRDYFDYIYSAKSLITLEGKKLHAKRNYINRFIKKEWSVEPITPENIEECRAFNKFWCDQNGCDKDESKREEMCAASRAIDNFEYLQLKGCILKQEGKVVAYSIGEKINSDTVIVHVEKANAEIPGAYPMVNKCFAEMFAADVEYINREEDMGVEGLRKAKLSYFPVRFTERYRVTIK